MLSPVQLNQEFYLKPRKINTLKDIHYTLVVRFLL